MRKTAQIASSHSRTRYHRIGYDGDDICFDMDVNGIYRYTSKFDKQHPSTGAASFWHS